MTPATQEQIKAAVATHTAMEAHRYLASVGLRATPQHCKIVKDDARSLYRGFAS